MTTRSHKPFFTYGRTSGKSWLGLHEGIRRVLAHDKPAYVYTRNQNAVDALRSEFPDMTFEVKGDYVVISKNRLVENRGSADGG